MVDKRKQYTVPYILSMGFLIYAPVANIINVNLTYAVQVIRRKVIYITLTS